MDEFHIRSVVDTVYDKFISEFECVLFQSYTQLKQYNIDMVYCIKYGIYRVTFEFIPLLTRVVREENVQFPVNAK